MFFLLTILERKNTTAKSSQNGGMVFIPLLTFLHKSPDFQNMLLLSEIHTMISVRNSQPSIFFQMYIFFIYYISPEVESDLIKKSAEVVTYRVLLSVNHNFTTKHY